MGAYTCEFGVVHKTCRCPEKHSVVCDQGHGYVPKHRKDVLDHKAAQKERE